MNRNLIKITYNIDNDDWSDQEFEDQEERVLIITSQDIVEFIYEKDRNLHPNKETVSYEHISVEKL
jgi:hypothetical protein